MFFGKQLSKENQAVIAARIKQRVREFLPEGQYLILVQEIPCADHGCPTRATVISVCDEQGKNRRWGIHAPMSLVTFKEIEVVMNSTRL